MEFLNDPRWLQAGFFIRLENLETKTKEFYFVDEAHFGRYRWEWVDDSGDAETIASDTEKGPRNIENLKPLALEHLFQVLAGYKTACLFYQNWPGETRLMGVPKAPLAVSSNRYIGWISHNESPWDEPTFAAEIFLQKGGSFEWPVYFAYNPTDRTLRPEIYFYLNKLVLKPVIDAETVEKLQKKLIRFRPISFGGLAAKRTGPD